MYDYADRLMAAVRENIRREFGRLNEMKFDELNVIDTREAVKNIYERIDRYNKAAYLKIAKRAYKNATALAIAAGYKTKKEREIDAKWVIALLAAYNLVTGYLYESELNRKRLRLTEAILCGRDFKDTPYIRNWIRKGGNFLWTQSQEYAIDSVDAATLDGYRDMGVEYVKWMSQEDGKACKECNERNGNVYPITDAPEKPHYNCRCYYVPATKDDIAKM